MEYFFIGLFVGSTLGFVFAAMLAANDGDA
jgi:gas vesicle protein